MKIQQMRITPIAMADPPLLNAAGLHAPYALRTIVEIETDAGITGISEVPGDQRTNRALEIAREAIVGADPFQLNRIRSRVDEHAAGRNSESEGRGLMPWDRRVAVHVHSAIDVACHDLVGKAVERPVCDLLGGAVRERVPFSAYLFFKHVGAGGALGFDRDPSATGWAGARQSEARSAGEIVSQARAMVDEYGFQSIKLKGGVFEPSVEVESLLALREAFGGSTPLRIDPNGLWSVETSIYWGRKLKGLLEYLEDPTRGQAQMAEVRRAVEIPLATNMCTTSFDDVPGSVTLGSEDIVLADHHFWGGLRPTVELARICTVFGRGMSMHSNSHLGISLAAMTHIGAAIPNLTYALDTHYPWQADEVITGGKVRFEDGALPAPTRPGLGVEIDRAALERLHANYLSCGLTERNDEVEMQKIEPGWKFQPVRW